jgi:hypothetical protein
MCPKCPHLTKGSHLCILLQLWPHGAIAACSHSERESGVYFAARDQI